MPASANAREPETSAVPADDGLRLDDDKNVRPAGPTAEQNGPKASVQPVQDGPGSFAFEHRDLLSQGEDFKSNIAPTAKENPERRNEWQDRVDHKLNL